jgi:hypothetical protein
MATHSPTRGLRGKGPIPLPRHRTRTLLFTRATQRVGYTHWLGGATHQPFTTRPRVGRAVPTQNNGRSIYKPIETAYLHADCSDYGWGAVLNDDSHYQACGFWSATDRL